MHLVCSRLDPEVLVLIGSEKSEHERGKCEWLTERKQEPKFNLFTGKLRQAIELCMQQKLCLVHCDLLL